MMFFLVSHPPVPFHESLLSMTQVSNVRFSKKSMKEKVISFHFLNFYSDPDAQEKRYIVQEVGETYAAALAR